MECSRRILFAIIALSASLAFGLIAIQLISTGHVPFNYGILIELKSPNTTAYSYKWSADLKNNNTGLVSANDWCESYENMDESKGGSARDVHNMIPCLNNLIDKTNNSNSNEVMLLIGATSSMRHLLLTDADLVRQQFSDINETLKKATSVAEELKTAFYPKILTEEDEATFIWVAVNYLRNNIQTKETTEGIVYIDSFSSLIAYETNNASFIEYPRIMQLYGYNYTLRADGTLCNGIQQMYYKYLALLIMRQNDTSSGEITDPCSHSESKTVLDGKNFASNGCVLRNNSIEIDTTKSYLFSGSVNYKQCLLNLDILFDENSCLNYFDICPSAENQSPENTTFILIQKQNLFIDKFLNNMTSIENFIKLSKEVCSNISQSQINNSTALPHCFTVNYVHNLLTKFYKFNEQNWRNIRFDVKSPNDYHWSMGYMIYTTTYSVPMFARESIISMNFVVVTVIICVLLIIIALCFFIPTIHKKQQSTNDNEVEIVKVY